MSRKSEILVPNPNKLYTIRFLSTSPIEWGQIQYKNRDFQLLTSDFDEKNFFQL